MYSGYDDQTYYQDTGERWSKKARTDWDAPGATTQYSDGYLDTSSSTRYPKYLSETLKDIDKVDRNWDSTHDRSQDRRSTSNLTSCRGFSSVENVLRSDYSNNLQGYGSGGKTSFRNSTGRSGILDSGLPGNKGSSARSRVDTFSQGSGLTNWYERASESHSRSESSLTRNYGGSSYSDLMTQDDGFSQAFSSHSAAFVKPNFEQTDNSRFRGDANNSKTNRSVRSNRPADSRGSFSLGNTYEEQGGSRNGGEYGSQHGRFELDRSQNRCRQRNSDQNRSSNWKSQSSYGERDFDDTRYRSRSSTSGSLWHDDTRLGDRSVMAQGKDEPSLETDLAIRMATEIQQRKQGKVDVNKILKVMKIVDQMSESEEANINQGFVGGGSRGMTAKPGFGVSQDFLGMRGSSGRQKRPSRGRMTMMKRGVGTGLTWQGSHMGMIGQGSMICGDGGMDMMDENGGTAMMGPGFGQSITGQFVGIDMTGRESRKRRSSDGTFVENRRVRGKNKYMNPVSQKDFYDPPLEQGQLKSSMDMDVQVPDENMKNTICSFVEFLKKRIEFLKKRKSTRCAVKDIGEAVKKSMLGLKEDFEVEPVGEVGHMKTGRLFISGVFIARTAGVSKKLVKRECYEKALSLLTTQSAEVIVKQKDTKKDEIVKEKVEELEKIASEKEDKEEEEMEENDLEFRNKLRTFSQHMKSLKMDDEDDVDNDEDSVAVLSDGITQFGLDYSYSYRETESARGIRWFIGNLKIGDIQVGVGSGPSRKYAKRSTFTRAMLFLRKKHFLKIMQGMIETEACIIPEFESLSRVFVSSLPNNSTSRRLSHMIKCVLEIPAGKPLQKGIEDAARKSGLVISLLYKHGHMVPQTPRAQCDLFIDQIFISSGEGFKPAKAESRAYKEALTVLCSSSADVIFNDFKRMSQEDAKDLLEMLVIGRKERRRILYSSNRKNMAHYMKKFISVIPEEESSEEIINKDEIIVTEIKKFSNDDRYLKAYNILRTSAIRNFMILECKTSQLEEGYCSKLFLQHVKVGESNAPNASEAWNQAAAKALFKLYQTRPTIRIAEHDENNMFSYETMKAKADALKEECGDTGDDDYIYITSDAGSKQKSEDEDEDQMEVEDEEEEHDEAATSTLPVNKWLKEIIEEMIKKFASEESLEEITFCGEFPVGDRLQIQLTAVKYNISTRPGTRNGLKHIDVYQRHLPAKMLEILQNNDGHSGLYSIIPKDELPKPSDFEAFRSLQKKQF